ncbi:MAG TPA: hypothetical protein VFV66_17710 [Nonomuraea sp.]|nr:hypothetical protein [Nonomuraea sp.]
MSSLALSGLAFGRHAYAATGIDYLARQTFDDLDREFHSGDWVGQPGNPNDDTVTGKSGDLAWGQSYVLIGLLRMYEAYRDTHYLDRFVANADLVLSMRDSERGVTDYRGLSLPAWRANHPYTVGTVTLTDAGGKPILEVRIGRVYCNSTTVTVSSGSAPGLFTLLVVHAQSGSRQTFANLSMDPASPNYAVRRLYDAYPGAVLVTGRDVRQAPAPEDIPVNGRFQMQSLPGIFAVHTGMITYPMASFVRIVQSSPTLRSNPLYGAKAKEYLAAVRDAVAVHDPEWRENASGGYLIWVKGSPQQWDGCEQPINQSLGLGQTLAELAVITDDPTYRHRASALAAMFRAELAVDADDAYTWHYWPTYSRVYTGFDKTGSPDTDVSLYNPNLRTPQRQIEDLSHGAISLDFAVRAFRNHLGLDGQDMARLARTFTHNLAATRNERATAFVRLNGTGGPDLNYAYQAPRWAPIAWWDPTIHDHSLAIYNDNQPTAESLQTLPGWLLGTIAHLQWFARRDA